jgi:hypothetical protein
MRCSLKTGRCQRCLSPIPGQEKSRTPKEIEEAFQIITDEIKNLGNGLPPEYWEDVNPAIKSLDWLKESIIRLKKAKEQEECRP